MFAAFVGCIFYKIFNVARHLHICSFRSEKNSNYSLVSYNRLHLFIRNSVWKCIFFNISNFNSNNNFQPIFFLIHQSTVELKTKQKSVENVCIINKMQMRIAKLHFSACLVHIFLYFFFFVSSSKSKP